MAREPTSTLELLGAFRLRIPDRVVPLRPTPRRLVALLAVCGPQSRQDAAGKLWPDLASERAYSNVRTAIWRLRVDAPGVLADEGGALALPDTRSDFETVKEWARRALRLEDDLHARGTPRKASAELLPTWGDDWLIDPREELRMLQLHAFETLAQRLLTAGRLAEACDCALAAVMMDPLRESATRLLVEIHLREGNFQDAVRRYDRFRTLLERELGATPSPAITSLVAPLIAARRHPSVVRPMTVPGHV